MPITEQDLELLECFLDDALEVDEVTALQARLAQESELTASLEQLRAQRRIRRDFWTALEPDETSADALAARICASIHRRHRFDRALRSLRYVAAAAACITIGLLLRPALDRPPAANIPTAKTNGVDVKAVSSYEVTLRDETGKVMAVQRFDSVEKAQEFAADLARWQARQERLAGGRFVVTADRF